MSPDARKRQLQKLAQRRATERQRQRRQRVIAGVVAAAVAVGGIGLAAAAFLGGDEEAPGKARGTPQPGPTATPKGDVACGAKVPKASREEKPTFDKPPQTQIDPNKSYSATMQTSCGTIELELFADQTPVTVNSFVFLAREGFFDGLTFHRVIPGFVLQGGDPEGTGAGGPGYQFEDEIVKELTFDDAGLLAMANSGPDTNGSQFFITAGPAKHLDGLHTIFGRVAKGIDVIREIEALGTESGTPSKTIYIEKVTIEER